MYAWVCVCDFIYLPTRFYSYFVRFFLCWMVKIFYKTTIKRNNYFFSSSDGIRTTVFTFRFFFSHWFAWCFLISLNNGHIEFHRALNSSLAISTCVRLDVFFFYFILIEKYSYEKTKFAKIIESLNEVTILLKCCFCLSFNFNFSSIFLLRPVLFLCLYIFSSSFFYVVWIRVSWVVWVSEYVYFLVFVLLWFFSALLFFFLDFFVALTTVKHKMLCPHKTKSHRILCVQHSICKPYAMAYTQC